MQEQRRFYNTCHRLFYFCRIKERRIPEINEFFSHFLCCARTFIIDTRSSRCLRLLLKDLSLVYFLLSQQLFMFAGKICPRIVFQSHWTWDAHGWDNSYTTQAAIPLVLNQGNLIGLFGIIGIGTILSWFIL